MKAGKATDLIVALARKKAAEGLPKRQDDLRTCAKGILAAIKSESEDDLVTALRALNEVSRGDETN